MIDSLRWTRLLPYLPNPTLAPLQMGRRQSQLQRVQHLSNLQKINASNTENRDPRTSPTALLKTELKKQCARADDNARKLHNKAREAQRAKTARDVLRLEKRQLTHMSRMRASRVPNQKQLVVARALKQAPARPGDLYMKDKGVIKEDCQEMLRELQVLNVPVEKINAVIHVVAKGFGLNVKDQINWHRRYDTDGKILSKTVIGKMKKEDKMMQLIVAVERYNMLSVSPAVAPQVNEPDVTKEATMDWEATEDVEDADMEDC